MQYVLTEKQYAAVAEALDHADYLASWFDDFSDGGRELLDRGRKALNEADQQVEWPNG